jgi:hypothetical protein
MSIWPNSATALQQLRDTVDLAQVGGQAEETAAQRRHALDGFRRFNDIDTDDIAARFRQAQRHALTQTRITPLTTATFPCRENASRIIIVP